MTFPTGRKKFTANLEYLHRNELILSLGNRCQAPIQVEKELKELWNNLIQKNSNHSSSQSKTIHGNNKQAL
ncbi:MAG: hypothetical protein NY202_04215 [Mollicutes bacterium UO1]